MSEVIALLCENRNENEDEVACYKIGNTIESAEEKNEIKKVTEVAIRNAQSAKEMPAKEVELEQGEENDPRIVAFSKTSHERSIEDMCHSNDKKEKLHVKDEDNK